MSGVSPGWRVRTVNSVVPVSSPDGITPAVQSPKGLVHPSTKNEAVIGELTAAHFSGSSVALAEAEIRPIINPASAAVPVRCMGETPWAADTTREGVAAIVTFEGSRRNPTSSGRQRRDRLLLGGCGLEIDPEGDRAGGGLAQCDPEPIAPLRQLQHERRGAIRIEPDGVGELRPRIQHRDL